MWYAGVGTCTHSQAKNEDHNDPFEDSGCGKSQDLTATKEKILHYITVGTFLESKARKDLSNLTEKDFLSKEEFLAWCKSKSVRNYKTIPYESIKEHIKTSL
jgi:hypothetical protein